MHLTVYHVISLIAAYLIGSLNMGVILSKAIAHDDIRTHGSGNAGATNALRTYGPKVGFSVFAGDFLKCFLVALITSHVFGRDFGWICGLVCVLGHIFPLYFGFKGGKGAAATAALIAACDIKTFIVIAIMLLITFFIWRTVSISSLICAAALPFLVLFFGGSPIAVTVAFLAAVVVWWSHRENIKRILAGEEPKTNLRRKKEEKTDE